MTDHIFVAGDVARAPHVLYDYEFLSQEHWDNAVFGAQVAANNMLHLEVGRRPHLPLPSFWSGQFGVNIKSVGVCSYGDGSSSPRLARRSALRRRVRQARPHRRRGHLQPRQWLPTTPR